MCSSYSSAHSQIPIPGSLVAKARGLKSLHDVMIEDADFYRLWLASECLALRTPKRRTTRLTRLQPVKKNLDEANQSDVATELYASICNVVKGPSDDWHREAWRELKKYQYQLRLFVKLEEVNRTFASSADKRRLRKLLDGREPDESSSESESSESDED